MHSALGPGLLESAYARCLLLELVARNLRVEIQKPLPLRHRGVTIDSAYRADLVVENEVLIEVKALETLAVIHKRQIRTYLRIGRYRVGLLLNFGAATMKEGIVRVVNGFPDEEDGGETEGSR